MTPSTDGTGLSAEQIVRDAALAIGLNNEVHPSILNLVCRRMKEEFVNEEWQLANLDSSQWKDLGAPIGLASAVRHFLTHQQKSFLEATSLSSNKQSLLSTKTAKFPSMLTKSSLVSETSATSTRTSSGRSDKEKLEHEQNQVHEKEIKEDSGNTQENGTEIRSKPPTSLWEVLKFKGVNRCGSRPFPMSNHFFRAILHSKSAAESKEFKLFVMELHVVVSALLAGVSTDLWASFPQDYVSESGVDNEGPYVSPVMATLFHTFCFISLLVQLLITFSWIFFLYVAAAVSVDNFPTFLHQTRYIESSLMFLVEYGYFCITISAVILFSSLIWSTTSLDYIRYFLGVLVPVVIVCALLFLFHSFIEYLGRVAFHGMLLQDDNCQDLKKKSFSELRGHQGTAKKMEENLSQSFFRHLRWEEEEVVDLLCCKHQADKKEEATAALSAPWNANNSQPMGKRRSSGIPLTHPFRPSLRNVIVEC